MKNKNKLLLSVSSAIIAPISVLAIVSCQATIDQRVQTVADEIGNNNYEYEESNKNWIAKNKNVDAIGVSENINKANNKTDEAFKYIKLPDKSQSFMNESGTTKIEIVTCEVDDKYNIEHSNSDSRLKISFKVKKGNELSEIKYIYAIGFKGVQERYKKDIEHVANGLEKIKLKTENSIYAHQLDSKNLIDHIDGLPDSYIPTEKPAAGIYDNKICVYLEKIEIHDDWKSNTASVTLTFDIHKGKESELKKIKIDGFISEVQQNNSKEVDNEINNLNNTIFKANPNNNIYIKDLKTAEQLSNHVIGLPDYFVPEELPAFNNVNDDKIRLWVLKFKNLRDSIESNVSASIDVEFQIIKGKTVKHFVKTIDGFISTGQNNKIEIDKEFEVLNNKVFSVNQNNNIHVKNLNVENLHQHIVGLPEYFIPEMLPQNLDTNNNKTRLYASEIIKHDNDNPNASASVDIKFHLIKGKIMKEFIKTIDGFISTGQNNQKIF